MPSPLEASPDHPARSCLYIPEFMTLMRQTILYRYLSLPTYIRIIHLLVSTKSYSGSVLQSAFHKRIEKIVDQ